MFEMYIESGMNKLRCGYTTGSCATGAAKAATMLLFDLLDNEEELNEIEIDTPKSIKIQMPIDKVLVGKDFVQCTILKFSGDDKDITMGLEIQAKVEKISKKEAGKLSESLISNKNNTIVLDGGIGVGRATKEGLFVAKGEPAINPVPRKMIIKQVEDVLPKEQCVKITISVPQGEEIGKKTFNPRLGIEGGISILGTSGIVYPMSEDALKSSIKLEINQKSLKNKNLILTFGNLGENYCKNLGYNEEQIIICSNFIGFALECCVSCNVKSIIIVGHIGKMSKIAYGCFNTHSRVCGVRLEVIALELALLGYDISLINKVLNEKTCEGAVKLLGDGYEKLYANIGKKIINSMKNYVYDELKVDGIMYYGASNPILLWSSCLE
ncbi:cobalt-precorrin-5B (C(1))-methyltransferase CbiD [Clostridium taeniosporum]|uniref:Cobalt-precorrin-5B C(1)-methyltransferase n=1 Tax=Clostridium taeniosporum TaxID=394958 RepID=A0A1D7XME0_9CLOT|nr:cobalt-precorrin-5B (C(1))-methyltransferase CbiD [Clostridium taeniosporum]AOR24279.1 cobalamin biosynthesis protein CbiD [Clostridium taeniosporum]